MTFSATVSPLFVVHVYNVGTGRLEIWGPFGDADAALVFFNCFLSDTHPEKDGWARDIVRLLKPEAIDVSQR